MRISAVANDDPDCVLPAPSSLPAQGALFGQGPGSLVRLSPEHAGASRLVTIWTSRPRKPADLLLTGLLHHLDEHFSGLRLIAHFPQERNASSMHSVRRFRRTWKPRRSTEVISSSSASTPANRLASRMIKLPSLTCGPLYERGPVTCSPSVIRFRSQVLRLTPQTGPRVPERFARALLEEERKNRPLIIND